MSAMKQRQSDDWDEAGLRRLLAVLERGADEDDTEGDIPWLRGRTGILARFTVDPTATAEENSFGLIHANITAACTIRRAVWALDYDGERYVLLAVRMAGCNHVLWVPRGDVRLDDEA